MQEERIDSGIHTHVSARFIANPTCAKKERHCKQLKTTTLIHSLTHSPTHPPMFACLLLCGCVCVCLVVCLLNVKRGACILRATSIKRPDWVQEAAEVVVMVLKH